MSKLETIGTKTVAGLACSMLFATGAQNFRYLYLLRESHCAIGLEEMIQCLMLRRSRIQFVLLPVTTHSLAWCFDILSRWQRMHI
jgi:hypothetical protein